MISNILKFLTLFYVSFLLLSCSKDDQEQEDFGTTTGNYFPLVTNNKWWYQNNDEEVSLVYVSSLTNFNDIPYHRIHDDSSEYEIPTWITKKGASYYQKVGEVLLSQGNATINVGEYEIKLLRDDLSVGETWSGSSPLKVLVFNGGTQQSLPSSISYTATILARDVTETIFNYTYTNIIKMRMEVVERIDSQTIYITTEYWFAKDVGLIKESVTSSADNINKTRYLTSFELN